MLIFASLPRAMNSIDPIFQFISAHTSVGEAEKKHIGEIIHFASYKKNELILAQGEIPRQLAFIIQGAVRIYYTDDKGFEQSVNFVLENRPLVPFDNFAHQTPSGVAIMTLEPTDVIWTSRDEFFGFLESFPKYEPVVRNILSQFMVLESEHSKLLRINPASDRYEALCRLRPEFLSRVPLKYIASYIGLTLETLSRVRAGKL